MSDEAALAVGEGKTAAEADSWERRYAEREKLYRDITEKVLAIVAKRLEGFDPEEVSQGNVIEWIRSSIEMEQEIYGKAEGSESSLCRQLEINFTEEFKGI